MALSRWIPRALAPAWFDEARAIVQGRVFEEMLAGHITGGAALNAGCGEGLYAPLLERDAGLRRIVNADLARPSVARRRGDPRHNDVQASVAALPFRDASFGTVLCSEVLEHVRDDRVALAELARVTRPDGVLLVSVPLPPAPFDPAHLREGYRPAELRAALEAAGFEVISTRECHHLLMRALYVAWHRLRTTAGRNVFPRAALRAIAGLDRLTRLGAPWDLVVLARRTSSEL